jgi:hypothetical protein
MVALVVSMFSVSAYANELQISKKDVDSNTWTNVGYAARSSESYNYATIKISALHKANGDNSAYIYLKVKVTASGDSTTVTKGYNYDITIPSGYRKKGTKVYYYCMGNNPKYDCKASGYFNSH